MRSLADLLPGADVAAEHLLLREFAHRIDDELTSLIGLISAAATRCTSDEASAALIAAQRRLQSNARILHSLQMPDYITTIDLAPYLYQLCRAISCSKLESKGIELSLSIYPLRLNSEHCWLLGMIVYELVTNAAQRVLHDGTGSIHVEVWLAANSIKCCLSDNGASDTGEFQEQGPSIIEALATGLHATVDRQSGTNGTRTVVDLVLAP